MIMQHQAGISSTSRAWFGSKIPQGVTSIAIAIRTLSDGEGFNPISKVSVPLFLLTPHTPHVRQLLQKTQAVACCRFSSMQAVITTSPCRPSLQFSFARRATIRASRQVFAKQESRKCSDNSQSGAASRVTSRRDLLKKGATLGFGGAAAR